MQFSRKIAVFGLITAAVAGGVVFAATRKSGVTYETEKIDRGTVVQEVSVTGSITPSKKISLQPEVGAKVSAVSVTEGDLVKAGDLLVELDSKDIQARIASQRAALNSARARLAELAAGATVQEIALAETAVATAVSKRDSAVAAKADAAIALDNARTNFDNVAAKAETLTANKLEVLLLDYDQALTDAKDAIERLSGPMFTNNDQLTFSSTNFAAETLARGSRTEAKAKLVDLAAAVASAKAGGTSEAALAAYPAVATDLASIKAHLEADREVLNYASGIPSATITTYQLNVSSALTSLNSILQKLNNDKSAMDLQVKLNQADVTAAQIALSNAEAGLSAATYAVETAEKAIAQAEADLALRKTGTRPEVLAAQRARVESEEATLASLVTDLAKRRIVSPLDAIVTEVAAEVGETVQPSQVVVSLNAKDKFEIVANISEVDIASIAIGQPVAVTLDAFPTTERWSGKVITIDPAEKVVEGVIFYETKIVFDQEDPRLKSGMTANLDIETGRRENVLRIPLRAIRSTPGRTYVEVLADGKPQERDVKIGIENSRYAELLEGVSEGEDVVVSSAAK